ncbi:MAG: PKD domain-containing protein [Candidatus Micrarchaeia archaeon]
MERNIFSVVFIALLMVMQVGIASASGAGISANAGVATPVATTAASATASAQIYAAGEGETCAGIANIQCASGLVCTGVDSYSDAAGKCAKPIVSENKPPVISGGSSPTSLQVGETGTWSVKAYDPENGQLTYYVSWGDEPSYADGNPTGTKAIEVSQEATFTHSYSKAGEYKIRIKVSDNAGQSAQTTSTVVVGAGTTCMTFPTCVVGYTPVFSHYDENGCPVYACKPLDAKTKVDVSISVQPQEVAIYNSFQVSGKITYSTDPAPSQDSASNQRNFKVVTSYSDYGRTVSAKESSASKAAIRLSENEGLVEKLVRTVLPTKASATAKTAVSSEQSDEEGSDSEKERASSTSVASVAATIAPDKKNSQERVDYITLSPGETTLVSAYFTPRATGTKLATITVYLLDTACPANELMGMPCKQTEKQVAQAMAKVSVIGDTQPPEPPQDEVKGTIALYSGWNMVSVPVDTKVQMADLAASCGSDSVAWKLGPSGYSKEDTLVPGAGYWVRSSGDCKFGVKADTATSAIASLSAGWNLVGALGSEKQVSDFSGNCQITSGPWHYSPSIKNYEYSSSLKPGEAYWVKVPSACSMGSSSDAVPPAPPA